MLETAQILALAPDEASAKSGRELATRRHWITVGKSDRALWGECRGSAKTSYQTRIDLAGPAFKCSCPSRKFPCKHGLGLMLLVASDPSAASAGEPPTWVSEWLDARAEAAEKKAVRVESAGPKDGEAAAKRAAARLERIQDGLAGLEAWLADLLRAGLHSVRARGQAPFAEQAARLVDAQAPGAARLVETLGELAFSGEGWHARFLERAAQLAMLASAGKRLDSLTPALREDVRTALGLTWKKEELLASGAAERVRERWSVLGRAVEGDERLRTRRTWLRGKSGRWALVLEFAVMRQPFEAGLVPGTVRELELAFYPGAAPMRAHVVAESGGPSPMLAWSGETGWKQAVSSFGAALAQSPWTWRWPLSIDGVRPALGASGAVLVDGQGDAVPIAREAALWAIAALSGGAPVGVAGEWDGRAFHPLSAWGDSPARVVDLFVEDEG